VLHPIYSDNGDYPPVMKEFMAKKSKEEGYSRSRLPSFTKEETEMVKGEFQSRETSDTARRQEIY
jgi:lactase-phlorizin hydrolase